MATLAKLLKSKFNPPAETTESFAGKTVLITGATTGLGLEAAKKIAALNADRLIITARDEKRGQNAKALIQDWMVSQAAGREASTTKVSVMLLDMSQSADVKRFAKEVKEKFPKLDAVILNAGTVQVAYATSPDGWEETIQVNTISTTLLGLLLLPSLLAARSNNGRAPHLVFVSSGLALIAKAENMGQFYDAPNALRAMSSENSPIRGQTQYGASKLLLEYSMRHIAQLPIVKTDGGEMKVICGSCCPGMCKSDLGRQYTKGNPIILFLLAVVFFLIGRTSEQGSNTYISALTRDQGGKIWKDDRYYDGGYMIDSEEGKKFGEKIWKEMVEVVEEIAPETKSIIEGK